MSSLHNRMISNLVTDWFCDVLWFEIDNNGHGFLVCHTGEKDLRPYCAYEIKHYHNETTCRFSSFHVYDLALTRIAQWKAIDFEKVVSG